MTAFVVIAISNPEAVEAAMGATYPNDHMKIRDATWIVRDNVTSKDVCDKLKITTDTPGSGPSGSGIVTAVAGYYGAANPSVWEFLRRQ